LLILQSSCSSCWWHLSFSLSLPSKCADLLAAAVFSLVMGCAQESPPCCSNAAVIPLHQPVSLGLNLLVLLLLLVT
jgi:hypothetical protein